MVERGWRGARECSLALDVRGVHVTHLIKGALEPEVLAMIRPRPHIRVVAVPRWWFRAWLWGLLIVGSVRGRWAAVLVDHERTGREIAWWCRRWGVGLARIHETAEGYDLWVGNDRRALSDLVP